MSRYLPVTPESMTAEQKAVYEAILHGPRGSFRGPFPVLLHSPGMAEVVQRLGAYVRFESKLPGRMRELAVLVTSRFWGAEFEWFAHAPLAEKEGVPPEAIEAIRTGRRPSLADEALATVYDYCRALHEERDVSDALYQRARELLGQEALTDLTAMLGYYTLLAMVLNVYRVPLPDGSKPFA